MSDKRHKALKQAVQKMLNSMEALSVDASGITRGSWVQAHLKEVQELLWETPIPAPEGGVKPDQPWERPVKATPTPSGYACPGVGGAFGISVNKVEHCVRCTLYDMCLLASAKKLPPPPAPVPTGFCLDAKIDKIMSSMPSDWNGKWFFVLIEKMVETFIRKNTDYAGKDNQAIDCLANFKASSQLGVTPLKGVLVRCSDKWMRIQNLTREEREGMVRDEAIVDTMLDLANYMLIAIMVHMSTHNQEGE